MDHQYIVGCDTNAERLELQKLLRKNLYMFGKELIDTEHVLTTKPYVVNTKDKTLSYMGWATAIVAHNKNYPTLSLQEFKEVFKSV